MREHGIVGGASRRPGETGNAWFKATSLGFIRPTMSTTAPRATATERNSCSRDDCDERVIGTGYRDDYCSPNCWKLGTATELIHGVENDHRHCASCYRKLKGINPPPPDWYFTSETQIAKQCACGWQVYDGECPTGQADRGLFGEEIPRWAIEPPAWKPICQCGATHHQTVERTKYQSKRELFELAERLLAAIEDRGRRGTADHGVDAERFMALVRSWKRDPERQYPDAKLLRVAIAATLLELE